MGYFGYAKPTGPQQVAQFSLDWTLHQHSYVLRRGPLYGKPLSGGTKFWDHRWLAFKDRVHAQE